MKKICLLIGCFCCMLLLCSCQSDGYYQEQAVQEARAFLLEELPEMPLMDQEYIKFNRPFFLVSQLSGSYKTGMMQVCICWMTPDNPELYMVYGASGVRMIDWDPQRIIRKNFNNPQQAYIAAANGAANTLLQNYFHLLSVPSVNNIRYTLPGVWKTKLPLNSNPDCQLTAEELAEAEKLPRYILAWELKDKEQVSYAAVGGTAQDDTLKNFRSYFSGIYSPAEFAAAQLEPQALIAPFGGSWEK